MNTPFFSKAGIPYIFKRHGHWLCFDPLSGTIVELTKQEAKIIKVLLEGGKSASDNGKYAAFIEQFEKMLLEKRSCVKYEEIPVRQSLMVLMVSQACNMACSYCFAGEGTYGKPSLMSTEIGKSSLDIANELGISSIQFFGGEPLLNFNLIKELVHYAEKSNFRFSYGIITNATLITEEIADFFQRYDFEVTVSLDGPKRVHDTCRRLKSGAGSHDLVVGGIKQLNRRRVKLAIELTYSKRYKEKAMMDEILDYVTKFSKVVIGGYVCPAEFSKFSFQEDPSREELRKIMISTVDYIFNKVQKGIPIKELAIYDCVKYLLSPQKRIRKLICRDIATRITVFSNGDVYPCHQLIAKDFYLGNVIKHNFISNFRERRKCILSKFSINLLKNYWFKHISDFCKARLVHTQAGYALRDETAFNEFFKHIIYRLSLSDVGKIVEVWGGKILSKPNQLER